MAYTEYLRTRGKRSESAIPDSEFLEKLSLFLREAGIPSVSDRTAQRRSLPLSDRSGEFEELHEVPNTGVIQVQYSGFNTIPTHRGCVIGVVTLLGYDESGEPFRKTKDLMRKHFEGYHI